MMWVLAYSSPEFAWNYYGQFSLLPFIILSYQFQLTKEAAHA